MKRGRPKGRSGDDRSFGPLGDLIRSHRLKKGLGLLEVSTACNCSMQFISNIEHGRAPLPWEKLDLVAQVLKIPTEELQVANLASRSDFKSFVNNTHSHQQKGKKANKLGPFPKITDAVSTVALATRDTHLQEILQKYQLASPAAKKKFIKTALHVLAQPTP